MNRFLGIGNLTKDVELRTTPSGASTCTLSIAINRPRTKDSARIADYIDCVAWRQTAELCAKYLSKGQKVGIDGRLQSRSYEAKDGTKRYVTEVVIDRIDFLTPKGGTASIDASEPSMVHTDFTEIEDDDWQF